MHKDGQKDLPSSYRPIFLLSTLLKVFEKLLFVGLEKFFIKNNIITNEQFVFRRGYSTEMDIAVLHKLLKNINEGIILAVYSWIYQRPLTLLIISYFLINCIHMA